MQKDKVFESDSESRKATITALERKICAMEEELRKIKRQHDSMVKYDAVIDKIKQRPVLIYSKSTVKSLNKMDPNIKMVTYEEDGTIVFFDINVELTLDGRCDEILELDVHGSDPVKYMEGYGLGEKLQFLKTMLQEDVPNIDKLVHDEAEWPEGPFEDINWDDGTNYCDSYVHLNFYVVYHKDCIDQYEKNEALVDMIDEKHTLKQWLEGIK